MKVIKLIVCTLLLFLFWLSPAFSFTNKETQDRIAKRAPIGASIRHVIAMFGKPDHVFSRQTPRGEYKALRYDDNVSYVIVRAIDDEIIEVETGLLQAND